MTREFIMTPEFDKNWEAMGLTDSDLKNLQEIILLNPQVGKSYSWHEWAKKDEICHPRRKKKWCKNFLRGFSTG